MNFTVFRFRYTSCIIFTLFLISSCGKDELYEDENSYLIGSGLIEYKYKLGETLRKDEYEESFLVKSVWYKPSGILIKRVDYWRANKQLFDYYLYETGSIRIAFECINLKLNNKSFKHPNSNIIPHGEAKYFTEDGDLKKIEIYKYGKIIKTKLIDKIDKTLKKNDN